MAGTSQSDLPAAKLLRLLKTEKGLSNRGLAKKVKEHGGSVHHNTIGNIVRGDDNASPDLLATLAIALGEDPEVFAEVRLDQARQLLDPVSAGSLEAALAQLEAIEAAGLPVKPDPLGADHELDVQETTRPSEQQTDGSASGELAQDREAQ
jgi:transcriptional regulator with XRE-family HTH domain